MEHFRDTIRFVPTGGVNKRKLAGRPPLSEEVVKDLRARIVRTS